MTVYAGGLRLSEATHLQTPDMDRPRMPLRVRNGKGGIHLLRHSFATHCIENGLELTLVQRLLGHSSLLTTARYLHVTAARLGEVRSPLDLVEFKALVPQRQA